MRFAIFTVGLCVLAAGCNADPRCRRETALLRAEILDLEDKYYQTKAQRDDALAALNAGGNTAIGRQSTIRRRTPSNEVIPEEVVYDDEIYDGGVIYESPETPTTVQPGLDSVPFDYAPHGFAPSESPQTNPRNPAAPKSNDSIPFDVEDPEVITPLESADEIPSTDSAFSDSESPAIAANPASSILLTGPSQSTTNPPAAPSSAVTEIVIDRTQTRGHDIDGKPGDDGLNVLLKPRSASGETVLESGGLTVSVIDPSVPTASQRIGLWKFLPAEAELFFSDANPESRGILLHLPWEKNIPAGKEVVVFVRFLTDDGRRLETTANVRIAPRSQSATDKSPTDVNDNDLIAGWINRDNQRQLDNAKSPGVAPSEQKPGVQATPVSNAAQPSWRPVR